MWIFFTTLCLAGLQLAQNLAKAAFDLIKVNKTHGKCVN